VRFSETDFLKQGFLEIEGMKQAQKQTNRSGKGVRVAPAKLTPGWDRRELHGVQEVWTSEGGVRSTSKGS